MRVAIAGAGAVGRSIARELIRNKHSVMLIERKLDHVDREAIPEAEWVLADACELTLLEASQLETYDVVIAATGDDKANLVLSLLAKTEFGVDRVVARVNDPRNEWLFDSAPLSANNDGGGPPAAKAARHPRAAAPAPRPALRLVIEFLSSGCFDRARTY